MNNKKICLTLLCPVLCLLYFNSALAHISIKQSIFGNGGIIVTDSSFQLYCTVGLPFDGLTQDDSSRVSTGFWFVSEGLVTKVAAEDKTIPQKFSLEQNYPNPFNPSTTIRFALPEPSNVTVCLYNILGSEVAILVDDELEPGEYDVVFDARNLSSGVYFYRIQAEGFVCTKKLMLLK